MDDVADKPDEAAVLSLLSGFLESFPSRPPNRLFNRPKLGGGMASTTVFGGNNELSGWMTIRRSRRPTFNRIPPVPVASPLNGDNGRMFGRLD